METSTTIAQTENIADVVPEQSIIQIGLIESVIAMAILVFGIGVAWGTLKTKLTHISDALKYSIEPDLKEIREKFGSVETKVDTLWKDRLAPQHSPRQLNNFGVEVLEKSGIKEIVDKKKNELLDIIKKKDISNVYDAEQTIFSVMQELPAHCPDIVDRLKEGAFRTGADIEAVLFAGSIYLRNQIFGDLGFSLDDLDKPKEKG